MNIQFNIFCFTRCFDPNLTNLDRKVVENTRQESKLIPNSSILGNKH